MSTKRVKSPFYTNPGSVFPVIQEQVHRIRQRKISWHFNTLMDYVRCLARFWSTRKRFDNETADHGWNIIWGVCWIYRDHNRRGRNTSAIHNITDCKYCLHIKNAYQTMLGYAGTLTTPTAKTTTVKCLFNSFVSTPEAKYVLADINFFTSTKLYQIQNIWSSTYQQYRRKSLTNITCLTY